jgi:hypothetical protein
VDARQIDEAEEGLPMIRHCVSPAGSNFTVAANLVALVIMIAGLTMVPGPAATSVTSAGLLLLGGSGLASMWLGRRSRRPRGSR